MEVRQSKIKRGVEVNRFIVWAAALCCATLILFASAQGTLFFKLPGIIVLGFFARDDFGDNFNLRRSVLYASLLIPSALVAACIFLFPGPVDGAPMPASNLFISGVLEKFWWIGLLIPVVAICLLGRDWWKAALASIFLIPGYLVIVFLGSMSIRSDYI